MKSVKFFILIFLILSPAMASVEYKYIKVAKTAYINKLWEIKGELNNMDLNMLFGQTKTGYVVYSGPYKNDTSANKALKLIKISFINAHIVANPNKLEAVVTKDIAINEIVVEETIVPKIQSEDLNSTKKEEPEVVIIKDDYNGFFIGVSLGVAYIPHEHNILSGVVIIDAPSKYNFSYSIESGYKFKNDMFFSFGYTRLNSEDTSMDNLTGSINYIFKYDEKISTYFGILSGYSLLKRDSSPLYSSELQDKQSQSFIYGIQLGALYKEYKQITPFVSYQLVVMNHSASLESSTGTSRLENNILHNLQIGIRF